MKWFIRRIHIELNYKSVMKTLVRINALPNAIGKKLPIFISRKRNSRKINWTRFYKKYQNDILHDTGLVRFAPFNRKACNSLFLPIFETSLLFLRKKKKLTETQLRRTGPDAAASSVPGAGGDVVLVLVDCTWSL